MKNKFIALLLMLGCIAFTSSESALAQKRSQDDAPSKQETLDAINKAITFYSTKVSRHGGYVYFYDLELSRRLGEGVATADQAWVQPPGTPTVGMAYLKAAKATENPEYHDAAHRTALALEFGQLRTGGWQNQFDLAGIEKGFRYAGGKKRADGFSSLDDGQSQSAIRFIVLFDKANEFRDETIHKCAISSLDALLAAQFPNGAFPQGWRGPVEDHPVMKASYPDYDWRTEGRIKNYWDMYTLNDNVTGYVTDTLIDAWHVYDDEKYLDALKKLGEFLLLAQMPNPQPAWAQQYNYEMKPIWARKFEPPGISGDETQEVIETLMKIATETKDKKYLKPIPRALAYLKKSLLPNNQLARYYELKTNRPLYMKRNGKKYTLTFDDSDLPKHYGWKTDSRIDDLQQKYQTLMKTGKLPSSSEDNLAKRAREIIDSLDDQGRWITIHDGRKLVGQAKFKMDEPYISSEVFSRNIETLSRYLRNLKR